MRNNLILLLALLVCQRAVGNHRPELKSVRADNATVGLYGQFTLNVTLEASYSNPYDYDDIDLQGVFVGPKGQRDTVDGFYWQDYQLDTTSGALTPKGKGSFSLRYSPTMQGDWSYSLICITKNGVSEKWQGRFTCIASASPGFIRRTASPYLSFDNGSAYIPLGENMGWANRNAYKDYSRWVSRLADHKGNFIRVWMPAWGLGLEWQKGRNGYGGLEYYQQQNAFYLDWLIGYCQSKGVSLMLSLDHHGQVSTTVNPNWNENPYNAANGGPCQHPWNFFTDKEARRLIRNRFRYIVARYGHASNIMCWELFNEVDWTDDFAAYKKDIVDWHAEMTAWFKRVDVYHHLVTTSFGSTDNDPACWRLPGLDFTQTHYYSEKAGMDSLLSNVSLSYWEQYGKPTLNGEFGINGDAKPLIGGDPTGVYLHNCLWATLMAGAMGPALPWYWDNYVDPQNLYVLYPALAKFITAIDFTGHDYRPASVSAGPALRVYALKADSAQLALWVLNKAYNWQGIRINGKPQAVRDVLLRIPGMQNGRYRVRWLDCRSGNEMGVDTILADQHQLQLSCPPVEWDLAATITSIP